MLTGLQQKTKIVFDASAKFQGKGLNSEALPGPKLQGDMFSILVRFRKELVALVGDVGQMYHQVNSLLLLKTGHSTGSYGKIWIRARSQKFTNS